MKRAIDAVQRKFSTVRTGRASPELLDRVLVRVFGGGGVCQTLRDLPASILTYQNQK